MRFSHFMLGFALIISTTANAQETEKTKKGHTISVTTKGLKIDGEGKEKEEKTFEMDYFQIDLGFNRLVDNTDYSSLAANNFIKTGSSSPTATNKNLFDLRTGNSINVNLMPLMTKIRLLNASKQKIYFYTGVGAQMYNFKFTKDISYRNEPVPHVVMDTVDFSKNKLGFTYASVPLGFTFKTKLAPKAWVVYGFGVTGGYRIASWTKQVSKERGKQKEREKYNFNDFNSCLTAEFGIDGYFRLYATYQITPLHETALDQHPLSIGFRFGGI
jgi:hypothetical protein